MRTRIFINLPVADLARSLAFYKALGYSHNPRFTDDTAACIIISEEIHVMALTHAKFREFTPKEICDTSKATEVSLCLSCESRSHLDQLVSRALAAGATRPNPPTDYGFMYLDSFEDPDGHHWELAHMVDSPSKP
ncbi:MAG: hypothetical protein KBA71_07320 [Opitutaceae bacterium]|nr:hypothetical protein [Opitutaceae bacterium]